jgi:hypothetical protein
MLEESDAFSLMDFASRHGISRSKVYGEIRAGRLIARKCGDRTIILAADGRAWREKLPKSTTNYGDVAAPTFTIVDWRPFGDGAAPPGTPLPPPKLPLVQELLPPSKQEAKNDRR